MPNCALSPLDLLPKLIVDDAKARHVLHDPFGFRVEARNALARHRVFDIPQLVPDQLADVELVVEDARSTSPIAVDRGWSPRLPVGPSNAFGVEFDRDGARGATCRELPE